MRLRTRDGTAGPDRIASRLFSASVGIRMRPSLFQSDDKLPTWLHTALLLLIVSPFSLPLLWTGVHAISAAHLEPLSGPEFGQFFFGSEPVQGKAARAAGFSLVVLGCAFLAIAIQFSRLARGNVIVRTLPWVLVAVSVALSLWVKSLV